jgi:hypothetical protein
MRFAVGTMMMGIMAGMLLGCRGSVSEEAPAPAAAAAPERARVLAASDVNPEDQRAVRNKKASKKERRAQAAERGARAALGVRGTYSGEPRTEEGRIDVVRLAGELEAIRANTYNFLIKRGENDWEDLQAFLPVARQRGINVWVTVTCPSKKARMSQPYGHDYFRWAEEIAKLSVREPNLVAWGMDDFSYNKGYFNRTKLMAMLDTARRINPELAFVPTIYYKHAIREGYAKHYKGLFDAVLFPYRAESSGRGNLEDARRVESEIREMRAVFGKRVPIVIDVYASRHSKMGDSTPEYVERVMQVGREHADGVMVFRHQEPGTAKWEVVSTSFAE